MTLELRTERNLLLYFFVSLLFYKRMFIIYIYYIYLYIYIIFMKYFRDHLLLDLDNLLSVSYLNKCSFDITDVLILCF